MTIRDFLAADHRHCDDLFATAEQSANAGDLASAGTAFEQFRAAMLKHFSSEEQTLFPAFEARTGMTSGPTQVMRMEHTQMRGLLDDAAGALKDRNVDDFFGQVETLLIMMQQHNMKEENVLYPMCDQQLADSSAALVERLRGELKAA
jgi:iron-sulfur cluster repair protein YtfE (RIC family)